MQCCEEGARGVTRVINGRVVTEDAVRLGVDLLIQDDRIAGIEKCAAPGPG